MSLKICIHVELSSKMRGKFNKDCQCLGQQDFDQNFDNLILNFDNLI